MVGFMCPEPIDSFCLLLRSSHEALRKRGRSRQALQSADGSSEMVVEELMPFGAAFDLQGQIKKGDVLVAVDGVNVSNMEPSQLGKLILGPAGSTAELEFSREEVENFEVSSTALSTPDRQMEVMLGDDCPLLSMQDESEVFVKGSSMQAKRRTIHIACKIVRRHGTTGNSCLGSFPATPPHSRSHRNAYMPPLATYA